MLDFSEEKNTIQFYELFFKRKEKVYNGSLCVANLSFDYLLQRKDLFLSDQEHFFLENSNNNFIKYKYLLGRFCAKYLVVKFLGVGNPKEIEIRNGIFGQPLLDAPYMISCAHSESFCACIITSDEHPVGVDLEIITNDSVEKINSQLTKSEIQIAEFLNEEKQVSYTRLWTAKESLSKILKTGLMIPFSVLEIKTLELFKDHSVSFFENFMQYKSHGFRVGKNVLSVTIPEGSELSIKKL